MTPHLKDAFALDNSEAMLVQTAFFSAYLLSAACYTCIVFSSDTAVGRKLQAVCRRHSFFTIADICKP
ncbi:MAG: hypothetical protein Q4A49_00335 [Neisseria sp.]|nr:hypothetical protein [Neisseria sp.]